LIELNTKELQAVGEKDAERDYYYENNYNGSTGPTPCPAPTPPPR